MDALHQESDGHILVPRGLLVATIRALRVGGDTVLDRDWDCYSTSERADAELYANETFSRVADALTRLLEA